MGKPGRALVSGIALAILYACVPTPGEDDPGSSSSSSSSASSGGGSSSTSGGGSSGSSGDDAATDAASSDDASTVDGATSDGAPADAPSDVTADARSGGETCPIMCVMGYMADGRPVAPPGATFCKGGCTWFPPIAPSPPPSYSSDWRNVCHRNCEAVCPADPPFAGVCPAECTGGCADGVCNIACDGSDPATSCKQVWAPLGPPSQYGNDNGITKPIVKCPDGIPCKVTCRNAGCHLNIVACPRDSVSCEIDCGMSPDGGCGGAHLYCGAGRCKVSGGFAGGASGKSYQPEYNMVDAVCGDACSCDIPYPPVFDNGAAGRCKCRDGYRYNSGSQPMCPGLCAAHGGWSAPWERTPYSW